MNEPLHQIRFSTLPETAARRLSGLIDADPVLPPLAVAMTRTRDHGTEWVVEALYQTPPGDRHIAQWLDELYRSGATRPEVRIERLGERDWVAHAQRALKPVHAGRFVIHGRHDRARHGYSRYALEIDAAQAFGTGHHATTIGCLNALQRSIAVATPRHVLDIGTGTGVLAIAAAKLCTARITASDIDPLAVRIAAANARLNGAGNAIRFIEATGVKSGAIRRQRYDLIVANILARPLIGLAGDVVALTNPGGRIILSGLLAAQARPIIAHYHGHGAVLVRRIVIDGWATLVMSSGKTGPRRSQTKRPRHDAGALI